MALALCSPTAPPRLSLPSLLPAATMGVEQTMAAIEVVLGELAQLEAQVSLKKIHLQSLKRQLVREQAERAAERAGRGRKKGAVGFA